jgi:UDP-glucuronate decarboxylase
MEKDGGTGPINIGNPNEFTMLELADAVLDLTGSKSNKIHRPLPSDDPKQRQPDITKAQAEFGWAPKVQLREGLGRTIKYFEELLAEGDPLMVGR